MTKEEASLGMKVNIPTCKSMASTFEFFLTEIKEYAKNAKYLTIESIYDTTVVVRIDLDAGKNSYYTYNFKLQDLTQYEEIEAQQAGLIAENTQFVAGTEVEEHTSIPESVQEVILSSIPSFDKDSFAEIQLPELKQGLRYNTGKRDYTLMDMSAFDSMIDVLEYGAHKYSVFEDNLGNKVKGSQVSASTVTTYGWKTISSGRDNWKLGGSNMTLLKLLSSLMRHLVAFMSGQDNDDESKLPHIGHMMCNLMFIGYHWNNHKKNKKAKKGTNFDDRFKS